MMFYKWPLKKLLVSRSQQSQILWCEWYSYLLCCRCNLKKDYNIWYNWSLYISCILYLHIQWYNSPVSNFIIIITSYKRTTHKHTRATTTNTRVTRYTHKHSRDTFHVLNATLTSIPRVNMLSSDSTCF